MSVAGVCVGVCVLTGEERADGSEEVHAPRIINNNTDIAYKPRSSTVSNTQSIRGKNLHDKLFLQTTT